MSVYIPAGCAHAHQTRSEIGDTSYRIDRAHDPSEDVTIAWTDTDLAIQWPLPVTIMSVRDRQAGSLANAGI
jgi:dTDP-4-dehydrorhamnose 3,5-epimerase